jgi:hypothetical protein
MFWLISRSSAGRTRAEKLARQRRLARLLYYITLALAALLGLAAALTPVWPRPHSDSSLAQLWQFIATDGTLRKACVLVAVGLWLTALVFFRPPAETPGAEGGQDELDH